MTPWRQQDNNTPPTEQQGLRLVWWVEDTKTTTTHIQNTRWHLLYPLPKVHVRGNSRPFADIRAANLPMYHTSSCAHKCKCRPMFVFANIRLSQQHLWQIYVSFYTHTWANRLICHHTAAICPRFQTYVGLFPHHVRRLFTLADVCMQRANIRQHIDV